MNTQNELWQKIQDKPYCDPNKRMDFVFFYDVRDGNPNGDPDAGNLPRMDPMTGHGVVTDVCIKRKIRDYLRDVLGREIYIQSENALNNLYYETARKIGEYDSNSKVDESIKKRAEQEAEIVEALLIQLDVANNEGFKNLVEKSEAEGETFRDWLEKVSKEIDEIEFDPVKGKFSYMGEASAKNSFDKGMFEKLFNDYEFDKYKAELSELANLLYQAKPKKSGDMRKAREIVKWKMCERFDDIRLFGAVLTAGTNAGQIRGPFQLTFGRSIERIFQMDAAITRCAITRAADWKEKQTEFGRKPWLNWAVYRQHGFFNPLLGKKTGIKKEDLARFWEALACMFRNSDSASKGEMTMHNIIVFVHDNPRGNAPSHKLFEMVKCENVKGTPTNSETITDKLIISRDGFDYYYAITAPKEIIDYANVGIFRPLEDIWKKSSNN